MGRCGGSRCGVGPHYHVPLLTLVALYLVCDSRVWGWGVREQEGFWNWVSGVLDTALYPHLAADLLLGVVELDAGVVLLLKFAFVVVLTIPNFLGLEVMDSLLSVLALTVLVPFVILVVMG